MPVIVETVLVLGACALMRGAGAAIAVGRARRAAAPRIAAFEADNVYTRPLPPQYRVTNAALLRVIGDARETRAEMIARMRRSCAYPPGMAENLPELQRRIERVRVSFFENLKTSYILKAGSLAAGQVSDRFDERLEILRHARHHLSVTEQHVVDLMDQVGVIDIAERALELIPEFARVHSEALAEAAANGVSDLLHSTATVFHAPGLIGVTRDVFAEFKYLMEDNISLGDALSDGGVPSVVNLVLVKVGAALDMATGWMFLGAFTIVCGWLGRVLGNEILKEKLEAQYAILAGHMNVIRDRERSARAAINGAVDRLIRDYSAEVERCPDIGDEPVLAGFVDQMHRAYTRGMRKAVARTAANTRKAVMRLPARNWLDRLLFIDRANEVADLFWAAERRIGSHLAGVVHGFSLAEESHAEDAVAFLQDQLVFTNTETGAGLDRLDQVLVDTAEDYARSLNAWEARCKAIWEAGTARIERVTAEEHALTRSVVEREQAAMESVRRRIAVLRKRLKLEPQPA